MKDLARQKKLEALRTAELNQQKKQMERAIAARAASEQAHGRGRKLSTEESGNYYNGGPQQIHTADVYSSIHKPKKTAQQVRWSYSSVIIRTVLYVAMYGDRWMTSEIQCTHSYAFSPFLLD